MLVAVAETEEKKEGKKKKLPGPYKRVLSLIPYGSGNPITVSEITRLIGMSDVMVRHIVSSLIVSHGIPIGTSNLPGNSGYFIITNEEERVRTIRNLRSRAKKISERARVLESIPDLSLLDLDELKENPDGFNIQRFQQLELTI